MNLPLPQKKGKISLEEAIEKRRSVREFARTKLSLAQISQLLWVTQGRTGDGRLRAVPSAGATYPLEVYLVAGEVEGLVAALYKYVPDHHKLEEVKGGDIRKQLCEAALNQSFIEEAPATIVIAADYKRTSIRYGARAERYVYIEVGHAGQNIYLECESLKLATVAVGAFEDNKVKKVLGIPEDPLYLMPIGEKQ